MSIPVLEIALTILLAAGFAATGEAVLRRRSAGVADWNEVFLVGAGCASAILFPLSLLFSGRALDVLLALLGLCLLGAVLSRILRRAPKRDKPERGRYSAADVLLVALIALAIVAFATLSFRYTFYWDGFQIYASKAKRLFYEGALTREWFTEDNYDKRLLEYPPLLSMCEALLARVRGAFDFDRLKPLFPLFYLSLIASTFAAVRRRTSRQVALWTTLLVALLPELATTQAAGGSSDMPLAAYVAGTAAACFRRESRRALPWLIGSLTVVKNEGTVLACIASAAILLFWSDGGLRRLIARVRAHGTAIAVVAGFLVSRLVFLRWLNVQDPTYAPIDGASLARGFERLGLVAGLCTRLALAPDQWGLFWPIALIASVALGIRGTRLERFFAAAVWTAIAAYTGILLFTNWDVELHASQAYSRLLAQIAPAAAIAIALSYWRLRRRYDPEKDEAAVSRAAPFAEGAHVRP